ncbi:MAG: response regulator transcription factor, partial [Candidatus Omnitrophota bacterium]
GRENMEQEQASILVIDDERKITEIIGDFLISKGFNVEKAYGGQEGLDIVEGNPSIDLVILDMKMPGLDGMAVIKKLESLGKNIPILIVTGSIGLPHVIHSQGIKCEGVLIKPVRLSKLLETIKEILSRKK